MVWLRTPSRVIPDLIRDPRTRLAKVLRLRRFWVPVFAGMTVLAGIITAPLLAAEIEKAVERDYSLVRRSEAHTSELQSLIRISYAVFCLKKKKKNNNTK